jgi:hypothetical protein
MQLTNPVLPHRPNKQRTPPSHAQEALAHFGIAMPLVAAHY